MSLSSSSFLNKPNVVAVRAVDKLFGKNTELGGKTAGEHLGLALDPLKIFKDKPESKPAASPIATPEPTPPIPTKATAPEVVVARKNVMERLSRSRGRAASRRTLPGALRQTPSLNKPALSDTLG